MPTVFCLALQFFGDLLGFIGAVAFGPTTFTIPPLMYLILVRPKPYGVR